MEFAVGGLEFRDMLNKRFMRKTFKVLGGKREELRDGCVRSRGDFGLLDGLSGELAGRSVGAAF